MIPDVLEHRLAEHCAPTLLGAKAASLLSLSREEFPELPEALRRYNRTLYRTGLRFLILRETSQRSLILVFRPAYQNKSEYESLGFMEAVSVTDFPIRDHKVVLKLRRRRWKNKQTGESFVEQISVTEKGTRYSKEFAAFLKETYGDIPGDLPYA